MDRLTQLQKQLDQLTTEFYEYVGTLQQNAPPAPLPRQLDTLPKGDAEELRQRSEAFNSTARQFASEIVLTSQRINDLINELPGVDLTEEAQLAQIEQLEASNQATGKKLEEIIVRAG